MSDGRCIAVVTGSRADFGLLRPVMHAIDKHAALSLHVIATGTHLLPPERTLNEVAAEFRIGATIEMQQPHEVGRNADVLALGRGISSFALELHQAAIEIVLVLGDRIEAFAAAAAASVGGIHVTHMHGGDRAEGIADEAMRHAITKLAHIHLPASRESADRIARMGENPDHIYVVGSPAIDGLDALPALDQQTFEDLGSPQLVFLMHPIGRDDHAEQIEARRILRACCAAGRTLALYPNHDPGCEGVRRAIGQCRDECVSVHDHLPRDVFIGLLRRNTVLVGNSSAGLIECAALGVPCVNIGTRQAGRERGENVVDVPEVSTAQLDETVSSAIKTATRRREGTSAHPFGDGQAGIRTADILADLDLAAISLRKRNSY